MQFETSNRLTRRPVLTQHSLLVALRTAASGLAARLAHGWMAVSNIQREQNSLRQSQQQLRQLSARLESVREEERTRLAYAIHDELGQILTALKMDVVWLEKHLDAQPPPLLERTRAMCELIDTGIQWVRHIAGELRPVVLDNFGLVAAIEWQLQEFEARTGVTSTLGSTIEQTALDAESSMVVYRIFQEILTNMVRHSGGTRLSVELDERLGNMILRVQDNGRGITDSERDCPTAFGILAMRERARLCSGTVEIFGVPQQGTTITVYMPLPDNARTEAEALPAVG